MAKTAQLRESQIAIPAELPEALKDVRDNSTPNDWCLCGYEADSLSLKMIGSGTGGTAALQALLSDDNCFYGLIRTTEKTDNKTDNIKFIFISFIGDGVKPMRRAKVSTFKGTIAEAFEPYHAELLNATSKAEVTDAEIAALLASMFGTVSDAKADGEMRLPGGRTVKVTEGAAKLDRGAMSARQSVRLPPGLPPAIAAVRDNASPDDFCLCGYEPGGEALTMVGGGSGGCAALQALLTADNVYYGLVRTTEQIDQSKTIKFVFVSYIGEQVPPMRKARISTFKGTVTEAFEPFHAELLNATTPGEVSAEAIQAMIKRTDGAVGEAKATPRREQEVRVTKTMGGGGAGGVLAQPSGGEALPLPTDVADAIAAVRSDADATTWCCLGYTDDREPRLKLVAKGEGPAEAVHPHLDQGQVLHCLVRVSQQVDRSVTVKFAAVSWIGDEVPPLRKAKLSSMRGAADKALSPAHTELLNVSDAASVAHADIMARLEGVNIN